jgi:hypothetical protein
VCKNLNYRNRMAQYAGRASVALHTHVSITLPSITLQLNIRASVSPKLCNQNLLNF